MGKFLIAIMTAMFIPAGVGLMSAWGDLSPVLLQVSVIHKFMATKNRGETLGFVFS